MAKIENLCVNFRTHVSLGREVPYEALFYFILWGRECVVCMLCNKSVG